MDLDQLLQSEYIPVIVSGFGGMVITWLTQRLLAKRGVFSYFVTHNRVGISTEDAIFGSVIVSWNGTPVPNLYLSTIEMKNESMNDYENVVVKAFTTDTKLMTEQTQLLETPNNLEWHEKYRNLLHVESGDSPSSKQWEIYNSQREYIIPVFNRG